MDLLQRYELILNQSLEELGPPRLSQEPDSDLETQAVLAPTLGDILYRLSVEHGVAFTPFRETVIQLISEPQQAVVNRSAAASGPFAHELEESHSLILLALEMMPPDAPF